MARNKVELIIKNQRGISSSVDIAEVEYRLNRTVFSTSQNKLKSLGGTQSTPLRLAKSQKNNRIFAGKSTLESNNKFNVNANFDAVFTENGAQIAKGVFILRSVTDSYYVGIFYDQDIDWVSKLTNINLQELGYIDGEPTWTIPFDGAITFNAVNDLSNRETPMVFPSYTYNNTVVADYLDISDENIWGRFRDGATPSDPKIRETDSGDYPNDFPAINGLLGNRLGLTFQDFPGAVYHRNIIEKIFEQAGYAIDCPLFGNDWFNKIVIPYTGPGFKYNWKKLATVSAELLDTEHLFDRSVNPIDERPDTILYEPLEVVNTFDLNNQAGGTSGITLPYPQYANLKGKYKMSSCINYDDTSTLIDKITAVNKFGIEGQYVCPIAGEYTLNIRDTIVSNTEDFVILTDNPPANYTIFDGADLWDSYATQDNNSGKGLPQDQRHYGWDDNVLIIRRLSSSGSLIYDNTMKDLYKWMSGESKDFINNPNDVIAYISPKRWELYNSGSITDPREAFGSPLTYNNNEVEINMNPFFIPEHNVDFNTTSQKQSTSFSDISITLNLKKNERVEMFWVNLSDIEGDSTASSENPPGFSNKFSYSSDFQQVIFNRLNTSGVSRYNINYNESTEELDVAANLPKMTAEQYISSFIKQFNLNISFSDNTVRLLPQRNYISDNIYDITSRVQAKVWSTEELPSPRQWIIGYNIDNKDRLLTDYDGDYGNRVFDNNNVYSNDVISEVSKFSSTLFIDGTVKFHDITSGAGVTFPQSAPDPDTGLIIDKGILTGTDVSLGIFANLKLPSIQSQESFDQKTLGDLTYNWDYTPRLVYHLGTVNQFTPLGNEYQCLIDSPRADNNFVLEDKHWFRPTVSQFDGENADFTGINYPTLRYDSTDGLYDRFFENIIELYNKSGLTSLKISMRSIDWIKMQGSTRIRYKDQKYRLVKIRDYDPLDSNLCTVILIREI